MVKKKDNKKKIIDKTEKFHNISWGIALLVIAVVVTWVAIDSLFEEDKDQAASEICQGKGYYQGYHSETADIICCRMFMNQTSFKNVDDVTCFPSSL